MGTDTCSVERLKERTDETNMTNKNGDVRIAVKHLWKIFGPRADSIMDEEWTKDASKKEVQEQSGHVIAIHDVSLEVKEGEVFVVMGLSGSGKSTLARCLIRLVEPTMGAIEIDGEDITQYDGEQLTQLRRSKTGMIFQHYGLLPHKKVLDNVAYGLEVQGISRQPRYERAKEVLNTVGLEGWEDSYPDELSGGMQQRVGIARALALEPTILIMDEPFSGLDPMIRREMQDELIRLQKEVKKTIVFITHDLNEALKLGDHIAIMRDGEIIQLGTPEAIVTRPADDYVEEFVRDVSKSKVLGASTIMQKPGAVLRESQEPQAALTAMRSRDLTQAFVVGSNQELLGVVTADRAATALRGGAGSLEDCVDPGCPRVSPETVVEDLVPLVAGTNNPIAVVDEDKQLLGEVHKDAVLTSMAASMKTSNGKHEEES